MKPWLSQWGCLPPRLLALGTELPSGHHQPPAVPPGVWGGQSIAAPSCQMDWLGSLGDHCQGLTADHPH